MLKRDKSVTRSLPKAKEVHGVKIEKVPIGRYLTVMEQLNDMPAEILQLCFPGMGMDDIIQRCKGADASFTAELVSKLIVAMPKRICAVFAELLAVEPNYIEENLTPSELVEVLQEWWELNDLTSFFKIVSEKLKALLPTLNIGSNVG